MLALKIFTATSLLLNYTHQSNTTLTQEASIQKHEQFELISVFWKKNVIFVLPAEQLINSYQSHTFYLFDYWVFCLFVFQTSACFTDAVTPLGIGYILSCCTLENPRSRWQKRERPKSPPRPIKPCIKAISRETAAITPATPQAVWQSFMLLSLQYLHHSSHRKVSHQVYGKKGWFFPSI